MQATRRNYNLQMGVVFGRRDTFGCKKQLLFTLTNIVKSRLHNNEPLRKWDRSHVKVYHGLIISVSMNPICSDIQFGFGPLLNDRLNQFYAKCVYMSANVCFFCTSVLSSTTIKMHTWHTLSNLDQSTRCSRSLVLFFSFGLCETNTDIKRWT